MARPYGATPSGAVGPATGPGLSGCLPSQDGRDPLSHRLRPCRGYPNAVPTAKVISAGAGKARLALGTSESTRERGFMEINATCYNGGGGGDKLPGEPYPGPHQPPTPDGGPGVPNPPKVIG